jgi:hypothetical protein
VSLVPCVGERPVGHCPGHAAMTRQTQSAAGKFKFDDAASGIA